MSNNFDRAPRSSYLCIILILCGLQIACSTAKQESKINHKPLITACAGAKAANSLEMNAGTPVLRYRAELESAACKA